MQIKQPALVQQLKKQVTPLYWLTGQDVYLLEESVKIIKTHIKECHDVDEQSFSIQSTNDWEQINGAINNYSLFSETNLITIFYDKKTIDITGRKIILDYLNNSNSRCFLIIRTPNIPVKQLSWVSQHQKALLIPVYSLNATAMKSWIMQELAKYALKFEPGIPDLIYQYTQGNMLASAQVIEKISLSISLNSTITLHNALEHVFNQCELSNFDMIDACLLGQTDRCIQILRQIANHQIEPTLILWLFSQEIRTLLQLHFLTQQNNNFSSVCSQLKIWPQKQNLYQTSKKRLNPKLLQVLLSECYTLDELIKTNKATQVWSALEKLALALCLGRQNHAEIICIP